MMTRWHPIINDSHTLYRLGCRQTVLRNQYRKKSARLPRKRPGPQLTPEGRQRRTSRPSQSRKSRACHAKGVEPKGRQRDARDVHRAPCRAESRAPATQKARSPRDARGTPEAYIPPLQGRKSRACHAKGAEPKGRQRDACRAESHAPATQKARSPTNARGTPETYITPLPNPKSRACHAKGPRAQGTPDGRQRRTSRPLQSRKSRACHAKSPRSPRDARGTPETYITPLAEQKVACLPRKRPGAQGTPEGRTSRPLQSRKSRACHAKARSPRDARGTPEAYITPLARQKVTRLPRKRPGAQGTPEGRQRRTSRPLQSRKSRACHAKGPEPKGRQRDARDVHHAPCRAESRAPATQKPGAQGTPEGRQRRTSRPLQSRKSRACHAKGPEPKGRQRDARDVHHAPCRAESHAPATQKARSPRDARGTPETYIAPLAEQKVARLPRKRPGAQGTPEGRQRRTSRQGTPEGRQRRTSRPLQSRKSRACHAKGPEPKGRQRDARDVHHAPCRAESRAPATQKSPRDARGTPETYITPLAEQKVARLPRKRICVSDVCE